MNAPAATTELCIRIKDQDGRLVLRYCGKESQSTLDEALAKAREIREWTERRLKAHQEQ